MSIVMLSCHSSSAFLLLCSFFCDVFVVVFVLSLFFLPCLSVYVFY